MRLKSRCCPPVRAAEHDLISGWDEKCHVCVMSKSKSRTPLSNHGFAEDQSQQQAAGSNRRPLISLRGTSFKTAGALHTNCQKRPPKLYLFGHRVLLRVASSFLQLYDKADRFLAIQTSRKPPLNQNLRRSSPFSCCLKTGPLERPIALASYTVSQSRGAKVPLSLLDSQRGFRSSAHIRRLHKTAN